MPATPITPSAISPGMPSAICAAMAGRKRAKYGGVEPERTAPDDLWPMATRARADITTHGVLRAMWRACRRWCYSPLLSGARPASADTSAFTESPTPKGVTPCIPIMAHLRIVGDPSTPATLCLGVPTGQPLPHQQPNNVTPYYVPIMPCSKALFSAWSAWRNQREYQSFKRASARGYAF